MTHRLYLAAAFTLLIAALLLYREFCIAIVKSFGMPGAAVIVVGCYALARYIHRREA